MPQPVGTYLLSATLIAAIGLTYLVQLTPSATGSTLGSLEKFFVGSTSERSSNSVANEPSRDPIVFVPGDAGSQLEARLNKTSVPHYFCDKVSDWFDIWINLKLLTYPVIDCLYDNLKLRYDRKTRTTHNTEGVDIRATKFGSLDSVDYLDILHVYGTDYFDKIITTLVKNNGYVYNVDMVGAAFDFRKAPNELSEYFDQLKQLIEKHYINNNYRPVTIICHSMGCLNSVYLLNRQSENWKQVYVKRMIALAAPWYGSFKAITSMLYGDNLGIPFLSQYKLQALQSTFPSLMYLFPREPAFNKSEVLIQTPTKNYSLENLEDLFVDTKLLDQREMWIDTKAIAGNLTAPNVELWCLYGMDYETPSKVIYKDSFNTSKYSEIEGAGDGTVNLNSLRACEHFSSQQEKPVYTRMFRNTDHIGILRKPAPASFISEHILTEQYL